MLYAATGNGASAMLHGGRRFVKHFQLEPFDTASLSRFFVACQMDGFKIHLGHISGRCKHVSAVLVFEVNLLDPK